MTTRTARIDSYFSLPTDLASAMNDWPSFVEGTGYTVRLQTSEEVVGIELVSAVADDAEHVVIHGIGQGSLFEQALGAAAYALAAHSDNVVICRWRETEA